MSRRVFLLAIVAAASSTALAGWYILSVPTARVATPTPTLSLSTPPISLPVELTPTELAAVASGAASTTHGAPVPPAPSAAELTAAALEIRATLVNIICIAPDASSIRSISASGVLISPMGYILTNAHVAQYFLLADQDVSCVIRMGDPARPAYIAELAYIPAKWVRDNASVVSELAPRGTGERDFALLAITGSATKAPLPPSFPYVRLASRATGVATPVVIGSYGAQDLSLKEIASALSPTIVARAVKSLYTFGTSTPDLLALGGSAAAQEGSSGGGVLGLDGTVRGCVTMSTATGAYSTRSLSAISATYIRREYQAETGTGLDVLIATPPAVAVAAFAPQARTLEALILATLPSQD